MIHIYFSNHIFDTFFYFIIIRSIFRFSNIDLVLKKIHIFKIFHYSEKFRVFSPDGDSNDVIDVAICIMNEILLANGFPLF